MILRIRSERGITIFMIEHNMNLVASISDRVVVLNLNLLIMVIFGGMSTMAGPILGAVCLTILPEFLRVAGSLRLVLYGVALVFFIIWLPMGIWGSLKPRLLSRFFPPKDVSSDDVP